MVIEIKKYQELDSYDKKQIRKAVQLITEILSEQCNFTGYIKLNFFEGNLVNANFEQTFKLED